MKCRTRTNVWRWNVAGDEMSPRWNVRGDQKSAIKCRAIKYPAMKCRDTVHGLWPGLPCLCTISALFLCHFCNWLFTFYIVSKGSKSRVEEKPPEPDSSVGRILLSLSQCRSRSMNSAPTQILATMLEELETTWVKINRMTDKHILGRFRPKAGFTLH